MSYINLKSIKVKGTWIPLGNYQRDPDQDEFRHCYRKLGNDGPQSTSHPLQTSQALNRVTRRTGLLNMTQDTWPACITKHWSKQDRKGSNCPPGSGADNGPPGQPGSNSTAVMTG